MAVAGWYGWPAAFAYVHQASPGTWLANLLLIQDYVQVTPLKGVTWTLSLEFAWYTLFAVSTVWLGQRWDDRLVLWAPAILFALLAGRSRDSLN